MRSSALLLLLLSCNGPRQDVRWAEDFVSRLECGMSLAQVQGLTDSPVQPTNTQARLGGYWVDSKWADVWLDLRDGRLVSVTSGRIDGLTHVRLSPKKDLCTGALTFFVSLAWVERLQGADVYLDGKKIEGNASSGLIFEVSSGDHELRVVKEGYEPVVKRLHLDAEDQGRQDILIASTDVRPTSRP
ncbi:MAG TPA: PEGA domain-containing protein [Thermoanaerobaculia bacterium]|nr:PEGA domain-containing protein [Thermoanaerobaculia bacterium]